MSSRPLVHHTLLLTSLALGTAACFTFAPALRAAPAKGADDRTQRMEDDKWTTGDRARDALDHLKKAEAELDRVAKDENSKLSKEAFKQTREARESVDEFMAELDRRQKQDHN